MTVRGGAGMEGRPENVADRKAEASLRLLYVFAFVLLATQLTSVYWLYTCFLNLDTRYELWFRQLQTRIKLYDGATARAKRDTGIQDTQIIKADENVVRLDDNETARNDSLTMDLMHLKQNYSNEEWIWLNKYSRVPLKIMEEFCKLTHEKCPMQKGDPGAKGDPGEKGEKGDLGGDGSNGLPGPKGSPGPRGPIGPKGDRGDNGERGESGLDGRPGIPGGPGLDGVPGRNGKDGTPGQNGIPGRDGVHGTPGTDGRDGEKGERGEQGEPGPIGPTGLPGTRGRQGQPGKDGIPGRPGISAQNCSVNGTNQLLVPPTIVGSDPKLFIENITVNEMENVKLKCSSTGVPKPVNTWRRIEEDVERGESSQVAVTQGQWAGINMDVDTLQFMNVSRKHMGRYMCIAENGIPPAANASHYLQVYFPPYIEIENVILNVTIDGTAHLLCKIEAYPLGVYYWEDSHGNIYEEKSGRFDVTYYHIGLYETILQMNITNVMKSDLGVYYCIGKNRKGITRGYINVTDEPGTKLQVTDICHKNRVKFGNPAPPADGKLCADCPQCKICGFGFNDFKMSELHVSNVTNLPFEKARKCQLEAIGKAVFHNSWPNMYGSWMRETYIPPKDHLIPKEREDWYFMTLLDNCTTCLHVFTNKLAFTNKTLDSKFRYMLTEPMWGNDHVIYNNTFFYATKKGNMAHLVGFEFLEHYSGKSRTLPLSYCDTSPENNLYKSEMNYVDVMSDENGVWAVCSAAGSNHTIVWKFNTTHFGIEKAWNITFDHRSAGDMFMICGILYAVDNVTAPSTRISLALDMYGNGLLKDMDIEFQNPFNNTTMIAYNHKFNELNTWDDGNMLTYPIKCQNLETEKTNTTALAELTNTTVAESVSKRLP